jgi:sulfite oxidase
MAAAEGLAASKRAGKSNAFALVRARPLNGGPLLAHLAAHQLTPLDSFFVRNHGEVPDIDARTFRLRVGGLARTPLNLSLSELKQDFPLVEVEAALQCAGNRRKELLSVAPVFGEILWGPEAISNARWGGVRLRDVLAKARPLRSARHASLVGLDQVAKLGATIPFGGSIPIRKARAPEVLLAFEMNGRPLPPVHGGPLRALVPGYIGARSVKWIGAIELTRKPSTNAFQRRTYKRVPAGATARQMDRARPIGEAPLNCAICTPADGEAVKGPTVRLRGYAFSNGGRRIARVEVSGDGGRTWRRARLEAATSPWALRRWRAELPMEGPRLHVVARCFDSAGHGQPASLQRAWNAGGYVNSAWHRVSVVESARARED